MNILVTGGLGYIGSHICVELMETGHKAILLDNLSNANTLVLSRIEKITGVPAAFYNCDLLDETALREVFEAEDIDAVIHLAAYKSAPKSTMLPLEYYINNVSGTLVLLKIMKEYGVRNMVYSSSACVYGGVEEMPLSEDADVSSINPYGWTKLMCEQILRDLCVSDPEWSAMILRYFNPVGAHRSGLIGEDPRGEPGNIAPRILRVLSGRDEYFTLTGNDFPTPDGTGIRDYVHICDLARAHISATVESFNRTGPVILNIGTGKGVSVMEMIRGFERASAMTLNYKICPRRPGDAAVSYAKVTLAREVLGWSAQYSLNDMCEDAWRWQKNNPLGYES